MAPTKASSGFPLRHSLRKEPKPGTHLESLDLNVPQERPQIFFGELVAYGFLALSDPHVRCDHAPFPGKEEAEAENGLSQEIQISGLRPALPAGVWNYVSTPTEAPFS